MSNWLETWKGVSEGSFKISREKKITFRQAKINPCKNLRRQTHDLTTPTNNRNEEHKSYSVTEDSDMEVLYIIWQINF